MCRALNSLAEERRRNQLLQHSSQVLEAKNHVLEARLEELHIQVSDMERRSPRPSRSTPAANGNSGGADGSTTPQTGWWGTWWGAPAADAAPALARAPLDPEKEESPPANRDALQKELDEWNDVVGELSHTKLTLAEVQGKLRLFRGALLQPLHRDPHQRPSMAHFCRTCSKMLGDHTE